MRASGPVGDQLATVFKLQSDENRIHLGPLYLRSC